MGLSIRRRKAEPQHEPLPRPNYTAIAVLEHDLLGIPPKPGTAAAVTIALRKAVANCLVHQAIETTTFGQPGRTGLCARCGKPMVQDRDGAWTTA